MDIQDISIEQLLNSQGIQYRQSNGHYIARCPNPAHNDSTPSWSVQTEYPHLHHCFGCGYSGNIFTLYRDLTGESLTGGNSYLYQQGYTPQQKPQKRTSKKPRDIIMKIDGELKDPFQSTQVMQYLQDRYINAEFIKAYNIQYVNYAKINGTTFYKRVCIPVYENGKLIGMEGRSFNEGKPKVLYPKSTTVNTLFGVDKLNYSEPVYVVEGITDLGPLFEAGYRNITALFGANLTNKQKDLLYWIPHLVVVPDGDEAGRAIIEELDKIRDTEFGVVRIEDGKDPGDLTPSEIREAIESRITANEYFRQKHGVTYTAPLEW